MSELRLRGVQARDFEALASTRNARGRAALWVGDIGDNRDSWPFVTLHRVWEPKTLGTRSRRVKSWDFTYPDRPHNAETLMVSGRSVWVATWQLATGGLYSVPLRRTVASAERLDDVGPLTTDGSIHPDERGYVLRDYLSPRCGLATGKKAATFALLRQVQGGDHLDVGWNRTTYCERGGRSSAAGRSAVVGSGGDAPAGSSLVRSGSASSFTGSGSGAGSVILTGLMSRSASAVTRSTGTVRKAKWKPI